MATAAKPAPPEPIEAFRHEARDWIAANFPDSLVGKAGVMATPHGADSAGADGTAWRKAIGAKGWGTPTWPRAHGGGGLSRAEAAVLNQEMTRAGAWSPIGGMGILMFGPTLLEFGSEAQKLRHMPAICTADIR